MSMRADAKLGSRRIFAPHFKLQVLDSYRADPDCRGNQRATARKYGIHRRQIQKWLQAESALRGHAPPPAPAPSEPVDLSVRPPRAPRPRPASPLAAWDLSCKRDKPGYEPEAPPPPPPAAPAAPAAPQKSFRLFRPYLLEDKKLERPEPEWGFASSAFERVVPRDGRSHWAWGPPPTLS